MPPATSLARIGKQAISALGVALLAGWCLWWAVSIAGGRVIGAELTWLRIPAFGVDFWTQPDYAARVWQAGTDPYSNKQHLFHYPPVALYLFFWSPYLVPGAALTIWVLILVALLVAGTLWAWKARSALGVEPVPLSLALVAVLYSFPVIFALERSNFDLITLAAILAALSVRSRWPPYGELLAGCLLSLGPWTKIYPGLLVLGLVALRWWKVLAGFVVASMAIPLLDLDQTRESFDNVQHLIARIIRVEERTPYPVWSHSLSMGWVKLRALLSPDAPSGVRAALKVIPPTLVAVAALAPLVAWVTIRVHRRGVLPAKILVAREDALAYPLILWVVAAASFVPQVANDYSLVFLPLAAVATWSRHDPWPLQVLYAVGLVWLQPVFIPVFLPVLGWLLLAVKVIALAAVAASLVRRSSAQIDPPAEQPN